MAGVARSSTPDGRDARAHSLRPPRARVRDDTILTPSPLLTERLALATPSLDASERSADSAKTTKRKRRLLGALLGVHDGSNANEDESTDTCVIAVRSTEVRGVSLEMEEKSAAIDDVAVSAIDAGRKCNAPRAGGAIQAVGGLTPVPDASETLVIRKKWRRKVYESSASPVLRCWSAEERVVVAREESLHLPVPLRRSMSSLDMHANVPKRPSLERRHLSAAAIDAVSAAADVLALPTIQSKDHPDLNVISPETVLRVLNGEFSDRLASFELIDCRFPYEHLGGSLRGSRSLFDPASVEQAFMEQPSPDCTRVALIFFCEFSANRAPKMARHMRNLDRWIHADRYPELFYPELYLIDGGYKNCFEKLKDEICDPPTYVRMNDEKFTDACRDEFSAWRRRWKAHKMTNCARQFQCASEPPAAKASATIAKLRARPVQSLVDQL